MEVFRALAVLAEPPTLEAETIANALNLGPLPDASHYTDIFTLQLYPYASVYLGPEGMMGGEAADRIAGFWRALGQTPPTDVDHLSVMLAMYARLADFEQAETEKTNRARWQAARKAFLWEHLLSWLPVYASKMIDVASSFYLQWAKLLLSVVLEESRSLGKDVRVSLHLRDAPGLIDPRDGDLNEFLQSLLTPVRSGMILVRNDLTRASKQLGLGIRIGERKFVIKSLLAQDANGMLNWLVDEANGWSQRHHQTLDAIGETAIIWENKAKRSAALLNELRSSM